MTGSALLRKLNIMQIRLAHILVIVTIVFWKPHAVVMGVCDNAVSSQTFKNKFYAPQSLIYSKNCNIIQYY